MLRIAQHLTSHVKPLERQRRENNDQRGMDFMRNKHYLGVVDVLCSARSTASYFVARITFWVSSRASLQSSIRGEKGVL
ncbi:hypothetical protein KDA_62080 [Dictyobacter alpinus]|uniref:Uncharacterized protein n=1 Tax=Dictyobacter alpinus TaxID=2014873 RepID=A0A402BH29_9CHLR|nr:hypothetical protein KDA_62080 [Dictyobacter alpinus]